MFYTITKQRANLNTNMLLIKAATATTQAGTQNLSVEITRRRREMGPMTRLSKFIKMQCNENTAISYRRRAYDTDLH